jgi:hypothetical protein
MTPETVFFFSLATVVETVEKIAQLASKSGVGVSIGGRGAHVGGRRGGGGI